MEGFQISKPSIGPTQGRRQSQSLESNTQGSSTNASTPTDSIPRTRMLLACDRCRARKSKCDKNIPSCTSCLQAGVPCMTAERDRFLSNDGRHVPRGYIEDLEEKVRELEGQFTNVLLQSNSMKRNAAGTAPGVGAGDMQGFGSLFSPPGMALNMAGAFSSSPFQDLRSTATSPTARDPMSFESTLIEAIKRSGSDPMSATAPNLLFGDLSSAFNAISALNLLQSLDQATVLTSIDTYFEFVHAHYPLLVRQDVMSKFNLMVQKTTTPGMISPAEELVVYMVVVVGMSVSAKLRSAPIYPQMLYHAALRIPGVFDDMESIPMTQALILIVIYSLYDPGAGSTWHLLDIVVGKCLSMGLHLMSSALGNGIEATAKTWAFWTLYSLDRMIGASMGRPFTVANDDIITVPIPGIRSAGQNDSTGFLSGPLVAYYQILYRLRHHPQYGFEYWKGELDRWRDTTNASVESNIRATADNPSALQFIEAMRNYIGLINLQGLLLVPQHNIEYPTITEEIIAIYGSESMYNASKKVGLSFSVHRFPLAWTAGYKAFATGMSYLLSLTQVDRGKVYVPEVYHVLTACLSTIESVSGRFEGLAPYGRFLTKATDMMLRLFSVESQRSNMAKDPYFLYTPYSDIIPKTPNSGLPKSPDVSDLTVRKFRSLARLYLLAMEDIRKKIFPGT